MSLDLSTSSIQTFTELVTRHLPKWQAVNAAAAVTAAWILLRSLRAFRQQGHRTTELRGPPRESILYGVGLHVFDSDDAGAIHESWVKEYGPAYAIPTTLGSKMVVLCDPKAIAHFYSKETKIYGQTALAKQFIALAFGKGILWAHGEDHKRQRKSLSPAFSIAAIRQLTPIFYDAAYKAKECWDGLIASSGGQSATIDIQNWIGHISLDVIGVAGFSHNFGALEGKRASVTQLFDLLVGPSSVFDSGILFLGLVFPFLLRIPTARRKLMNKLSAEMEAISNVLLAKTRKELELGTVGDRGERSIIGLLIKGANKDSDLHLSKEEIMAQMKVMLMAGYEATSISITWILLELSRNPEEQTKLRNELLSREADPTYDQFTNEFPYLDAVIHEVLRIHPPVNEITRVAVEDDVIPFSEPVQTKSGELVDSLAIAKGTVVTVPIEYVNRASTFWGQDAKAFRPSRWLEDARGQNGIPEEAKEIRGHRHLLTFADGPRTCIGKHFALAELKAVITVLIKNFVFEPYDGEIETCRGFFLPRPKLAGEEGSRVPLRVRPYIT